MKLFRKRQELIICIMATVMAGGFMLIRYLPLRGKMRNIKSQQAEAQRVVVRASIQGRQLPALREQLLSLQKKVENYAANIPPQRDLGLFLQQIADLMNQHKLKEQMVQPGKEIQVDGLNCILVSMHCKGGLQQVFEFYKSLQHLDRLVRIEHVKLVNKSNFSGRVSMQTKAVIYYRTGTEQG